MLMEKKKIQVRSLMIALATFCSAFMTCSMVSYAGFYEEIMNSIAGKGVLDILSGTTKISILIILGGSIFIMLTSGIKLFAADDNEKPAMKKNLMGKFLILIIIACIPTIVPIIFKVFQFSVDMISTTV